MKALRLAYDLVGERDSSWAWRGFRGSDELGCRRG
jgi:hypothetical protein